MYFPFHTLGIGLFLALLLHAAPSAYARVVISEVQWAGTDLSSADEWVEMACIEDVEDAEESEDSCAMSGWSLTYLDSKNIEQTMVTFPLGTVIGHGKYFLVSNFSERESRLAIAPDIVTTAVSIPNTKLLLRLRDALQTIIDEVDDGIGEPFAGLNFSGTGTKASMERLDLRESGALKSNWVTAFITMNLDPGNAILGTPGAAHVASSSSSAAPASSAPTSSVPAEGCCFGSLSSSHPNPHPYQNHALLITEILPNPEGSDTDEWIEIGNVGSTPVMVAGLLLSTGTGSARKTFTIPSDASGGLLLPQTFRSFRNNHSHLTLLNDGATISLLAGDALVDSVTYPAIPEGMSYGRSLENGSWRAYCIPTERERNTEKPIGLSISVQSGNLDAEEQTSVNVTATASYPPALTNAQCRWEYPDGFAPETCNPPSHALSMTGVHLITLRAQLACGMEERATVTVRIRPEDTSPALSKPVPRSYAKNSIIISAAVPYSSSRDGIWVALRNASDQAIDLTGFSLHGGLIPNDRHTFSGAALLPREERRFPGEMLRMDFPLPKGTLLLRDPTGNLISVLGWTEVKDGTIVRPPVTPMGSVTVQVLRVLDGDTIDVKILDTKDPDLPASILHRWSAQELSLSPSLRVRLIGIDAPELFYESGELSHSGLESLNAVRDLIEDKKIELQFDAIYWDTYERILAYVLLLNSEELLQTTLLREGNAVAIREFYHPYRDYFVALEGEAELQKKGLWALRVEPTLFTSAEPMMSTRNNDAQSSSSQNFFPDRPAFSPISSSVHSYSAKKIFKQKPASVVLVSQTKVKWNVQSASSEQDHESGSSILSSGSLLASLNIVDVEEDKVTLLPSSVQFSFVAFFSHFFHTLLDALRALLA